MSICSANNLELKTPASPTSPLSLEQNFNNFLHLSQIYTALIITFVLDIHLFQINYIIPQHLSQLYPQSSALIMICGYIVVVLLVTVEVMVDYYKQFLLNFTHPQNYIFRVSYTNNMKKKIMEANNKIYRIAALPHANQIRLKQIYDSGHKSRDRSPKASSALKKHELTRYEVPQTENKLQPNKTNRYRAYLQSQIIPKLKHNRRYSRKNDKQQQQIPYIPAAITSRADRNDSMDMLKMRKKISSTHKVSASSHTRLQDGTNQFEVAKSLYKQGKFQQALPIAQECLEKQPRNYEYQYYTAIIYLNLHNYFKGLELLEKVCRDHGEYKKTAYLFAAIAAKNLSQLDKAYALCSYGLEKYPNYPELNLYRANISYIQQNYERAHQDYEKIIKNDRTNVELLLKNAQCLKKIGAYANCLSNLAAALYADKGQNKQNILIKRIQIYLQPKSYNLKEAKKDLNKLIAINNNSPQILYLKGVILSAEGFRKESLLSFEQCLKEGSSKDIMSKALVQIVKNKINDRDFYSASYHINRSRYLQLASQQIQTYKLFSEGVVHLMKRKVAEGDRNFTALSAKSQYLPSFLKKIFYLYQAFAKFSLSHYPEAIECYELANKEQPLDLFAKFNKQLAQGIVEIGKKNYEKGFQQFDQAEKTISLANMNKIDPFLYRAAAHIQYAKDLIVSKSDLEELKSLQQIFAGLKQLDKAYDINDGNSNLLYYRGLVYLYLGKFDEALQDIIKAISKSEENVAKYFFFRALTHNSLGNRKQALNDLNICNNLDDKFSRVYLERAKVHFSNQNVTKGLEDLMRLKNLDSREDVKYHEACLNYFHGHYAMANACCDEILDQNKARAIKILIKTKLGKIKQAKKLVMSKADMMIYEIIQGKTDINEQSSSDLQFFSLYHYHHYMAIKYFLVGDYTKSLDTFIMANKERSLFDLEQGIASNSLAQEQNQQEQNDGGDNDKDYINRINYNIFLTHLQLKDWKKAYEIFIRDVIGVKESFLKNQFIASLSHLMFQAIKESKYTVKSQDKQMYELSLYDSKLDRVLPQIVIELPNFILKTRLCLLGLTNTRLENIYKTKVNPDFILSYLTMSEIENRPEPPWVKREESGLIFTDEVQNINIEFQTTENDEDDQNGSGDEQGEQEAEDGEEQGNEQYEQDQQQKSEKPAGDKLSVRKFKQKMKLDDSIQRKLQKIMERRSKND